MRFFAIALTILAFCATAYAQESVDPNSKDTVVVADQRYWWEKEGNLGVSITAKFNSTEQMAQTLYLLKEVGTFHSEKWMLQKILVSVDLNANGDVATWLVSGPKPLILNYIKGLESAYKDKSLFYDFGYNIVDCKPTAFFEDDGTFPDYED